VPATYFSITLGKVSVADYFDDNKFSHDPRTQFMSWALMDNGAWDYPANTRGYTPSLILEYVTPRNEVRYGMSMVPLTADGNDINHDLSKAGSHTIEYTRRYTIAGKQGAVRALAFITRANMGVYLQAVELQPDTPDIQQTRQYGNRKFGFGINAEQDLTADLGCFLRASWNDGKTETWTFTEIDRTLSAGLSMTGSKWKREDDTWGLAYVISGISDPHREYLKAGGKGFMLGDGNLNYSWEQLSEIYYSAALLKQQICMTVAYQLLINPGYNLDRHGPVNVFSVRLHVNI
jgi:high affinity Mn2+ porin